MTQTDVKSAHLNSTGVAVLGRVRLKSIVATNIATAGVVHVFDATAVATAITYGRSTTLVTVTHTAHGFATGQVIGLAFTPAAGVSATNGNYVLTRVDANSYTVTDINSGTITAGTGGFAGTKWVTSVDTPAVLAITSMLLPGEGVLATNGLALTMTNQTGTTIFYG